MSQAAAFTILAESVLALYPIAVKNIDVNFITQLVARLGTFAGLAYGLAGPTDKAEAVKPGNIVYNVLNLVHIAASYGSYTLLPAGNALALFYTYPFWTILVGWLVLGEPFKWSVVVLLAVAAYGTWLVSQHSKVEAYQDEGRTDPNANTDTNTSYGVFLALLSAVTETLIYLIAKTPANPTAFSTILQLYPYGALATLAYGLYKKNLSTNFSTGWLPLILFNAFIGFIGYAIRFYAIPKLTASTFSILSFVGVASAFFWQLLFTKDRPQPLAIAGSALIAGSVGLQYLFA
jgi:drug/metabolite transporter (DMT)-like permease